MAFFKKKPDPIAERARDLNAELAALEAEIKKINHQREHLEQQPRLRSTATRGQHLSQAGRAVHVTEPEAPPAEPIFEEIKPPRYSAPTEPAPEHFNELGVRKLDLQALIQRLLSFFRGQTASNPKLINYLAAGSIQGLRPLRYEKRVARNRFLGLFLFFFVVLWGLVAYFLRH